MTDTNVVNLVDIETEILRRRMAGLSIRRLSCEFQIPEIQVLAILDRVLPPLTMESRVRMYREDMNRLDIMLESFWPAACTGSSSAAQTCIKILERKAAMAGHDAPARVDVTIQQEIAESPTSTMRLLAALDRVAAERAPEQIEAEPSDDPPAA